jgi:hypothetical protein
MTMGRLGERSVELMEEVDCPRSLTAGRDEVLGQSRVEKRKLPEVVHETRPDEKGLAVVEAVAPGECVPSESGHEGPVALRQLLDIPRAVDESGEIAPACIL